MDVLTLLSILLPLTAVLIASSPFLLKYAVYRYYTPSLSVSIDAETIESEADEAFKWHELKSIPEKLEDERYEDLEHLIQTGINFRNDSKRELIIRRIRYNPPSKWPLREDFQPHFSHEMHTHEGIVYETDGFVCGPLGMVMRPFPFQAKQGAGEFTVEVELSVPASELSLPEFLPDFKLQPVSTTIQIES